MANGNVGTVFMTLGLKDETEAGLKRVEANLRKNKQYTSEIKEEMRKIREEMKLAGTEDLSKPLSKALSFFKKYDDSVYTSITGTNKLLNALRGVMSYNKGEITLDLGNINKAIRLVQDLSKKYSLIEDKDDRKAFKNRVDNALSYLEILQRISRKEKELSELSKSSRNIDKGTIAEARSTLSSIKREVANALYSKDNSIINTSMMSEIKKLVSMSAGEITDVIKNLKKSNPLSVFINSVDLLTAKINNAKIKLEELQSLQRLGSGRYMQLIDDASINNLKTVIGKMQSLLGRENKGQRTDLEVINRLLSETAVISSEAALAVRRFRTDMKMLGDVKTGEDAVYHLNNLYKEYRNLQNVRQTNLSAGIDVSSIDHEIARVRALFSEIQSIRRTINAGIESSVNKQISKEQDAYLKQLSQEAKQVMKNADVQDKLQRQKEKNESKQSNDALREEYQLREAKLKQLDREARYLMRNAETQRKLAEEQQRMQDKRQKKQDELNNGEASYYARIRNILSHIDSVNKNITPYLMNASKMGVTIPSSVVDGIKRLYTIQQTLITNNAAGRNMGLGWLDSLLKRNAFSETNKDLQRFTSNIDDARNRFQSLFDILNRMRNERAVSASLGVDTKRLDSDMADTLGKLKLLRSIIKTGVGNTSDITGIDDRSLKLLGRVVSAQRNHNREKQRQNDLERKHQEELEKSARIIQSRLVAGLRESTRQAGALHGVFSDIKSLFLQGGIVFGVQQFLGSVIKTGGEMEKQHIALQSILGDMQNANTMFGQVKELALQSPFTFSELNRDVKQLAAYGVEYENLYDTTKRLADMSSGLGVSFERIALAFGQVQARGWLDGKELRQIAYAGIPLLDRLSKLYSKREGRAVNTSEIKSRISNREVSFEDVKEIFWDMTDAGGQFYNMQLVLSETLLGRYNKMKDAWEIMLADFARGDSILGGTLKGALNLMTALIQSAHTLGPVMVAAFSGVALTKLRNAVAGPVGQNFLANKQKLADNVQMKVLSGKSIDDVEKRILNSKREITIEDLKALTAEKAITKNELQRLYVSKQITKEMYQQSLSALGMGNSVGRFTNRFGVGISLAFQSIKRGALSLLGLMGGWPGLIMTGLTMGITYLISKNSEMRQQMKQTQEEIADRNKKIGDFMRENNAGEVIGSGDEKNIKNTINAYLEKIKEVNKFGYENIVIQANQIKNDKDRLSYLEFQLQLIEEANKIAAGKLNRESFYNDLSGEIKDARGEIEKINDLSAHFMSGNTNVRDELQKAINEFDVGGIKNVLQREFGDISRDPKLQYAANQAMSSIFTALNIPPEVSNTIRGKIMESFGLADGWLAGEVSDKMAGVISESYPLIALKIRQGVELTDAEKEKVKELMEDAKDGIAQKYPLLEAKVKELLAGSNFQMVIDLVYNKQGLDNNVAKQMAERVPNVLPNDKLQKYVKYVDSWGKSNSWTEARDAAKQDIDKLYNEYQSAMKSKSNDVESKKWAWQTAVSAASDLLYYDYEGTGKKTNKTTKEDPELKNLRERINAFKAFRQMYQKAKEVMTKSDARQWSFNLFPEMEGLNPEDYVGSIEKLKKSLDFSLSNERKKALTELNREIGEWKLSEVLKPEFEKAAAIFKEALDRQLKQMDLWKSIFEKTGSEAFANMALVDNVLVDENARELMRQFGQKFGVEYHWKDMTDAKAKEMYKGQNMAGAYEMWKQITELLRNNYVQYLKDGADAIANTLSFAEKLAAVDAKYASKIAAARAMGDTGLIGRYEYQKKQEKSGILLEQLKSNINWDGVFGNLDNYSRKELKKIRKNLSTAVAGGLTEGMSTTDLQTLYDGIAKLDEKVYGGTWSGLRELIDEQLKAAQAYDVAVREYENAVRQYGENDYRTELSRKTKNEAENRKAKATGAVEGKKGETISNISALGNMLASLASGNGDGSVLFRNGGQWTKSIITMAGADSKIAGQYGEIVQTSLGIMEQVNKQGLDGFLSSLTEEVGGFLGKMMKYSIAGGIGSLFGLDLDGADYSSYNAAKTEYEGLVGVWDSLISRKKEYFGIHWGSEAQKAAEEQKKLLESEIEQTRLIAKERLGAGKSVGSHSIGYRMWQGSYDYNGQNWRDVAGEISSKYGVKFTGMEDMLYMNADVLEQIKQDYAGLWSKLDSDYKEYLEKLIEYGYQADDIAKSITEKLTGNSFEGMVQQWASAMSQMSNSSENLVDDFENNMKNALLNAMVEEVFSERIQALLDKATEYGQNGEKVYGQDGKVISGYTKEEYGTLMADSESLAKDVDAMRDMLRDMYGWNDNSSSSASNVISGITEEEANLGLSYLNSIRADVSVNRENISKIYQSVGVIPQMNATVRQQLATLEYIAECSMRNADAAEEIRDMFRAVTNNTKKVYVN
jgi:hypothetical protein